MTKRLLSCVLLLTFLQACAMGSTPTSTGAVDWDHIRYTPYEVDDSPRDSSV